MRRCDGELGRFAAWRLETGSLGRRTMHAVHVHVHHGTSEKVSKPLTSPRSLHPGKSEHTTGRVDASASILDPPCGSPSAQSLPQVLSGMQYAAIEHMRKTGCTAYKHKRMPDPDPRPGIPPMSTEDEEASASAYPVRVARQSRSL